MIRVELIYDPDCPNVEAARERLGYALEALGIPLEWQEWNRINAECPPYAKNHASPTILINGADVGGSEGIDGRCGCRIYSDKDGNISGVPSVEEIEGRLRASQMDNPMKMRESGMPDEATWQSFFDPESIILNLGIAGTVGDVVEFGCGYGTFTLPAARVIQGSVHALDIEPAMIEITQSKARAHGLANVQPLLRDFAREGTGLEDASMAYAMLFNILHCEQPEALLEEARRILIPGGSVGIIHWNHDSSTPRGPSMAIRPRPEQCVEWAAAAGFWLNEPGIIDLPPYHYGMRLTKG